MRAFLMRAFGRQLPIFLLTGPMSQLAVAIWLAWEGRPLPFDVAMHNVALATFGGLLAVLLVLAIQLWLDAKARPLSREDR